MTLRRMRRGLRGWAGRRGLLLRASVLLVVIAAVAMVPLRLTDHGQLVALRIFAIVGLAFLPGWLFLRFVTVRACSVWDEYVLNLHRLGVDLTGHLPQPPVNSLYHARWVAAGGPGHVAQANIYRDKFEAHYGRGTARDEIEPGSRATRRDGVQLGAETFLPVFLATAVFAAGWTAVLGRPTLLSATAAQVATSTPHMLRLGFVGAYLFTLQMLVRRYFQADLKASAYVNAVSRVVSAVVLVLVFHLATPGADRPGGKVAAAFLVGFFPLVGLQALQKAAALVLRTVVPTLRNNYPLSDLDGLSVWYEARLLELGIEDMQNLATANLVDVTLHSRVPVSRLVDWVDQAHLYLHLAPGGADGSDRVTLRRLGIRTATALEEAFSASPAGSAENDDLLEALGEVLNPDGKGPSVTRTMLKTLRTDPNLAHVRHWKCDWTGIPAAAPTTDIALTVAGPAAATAAAHGSRVRPADGQVLRKALAPLVASALHR